MNRFIPEHSLRRPLSAMPPTSSRLSAARHAVCLLGFIGLAGLASGLLPAPAQAQVSRCVDRQGNSVFSDRPCEAVDSASRVPHAGRTGERGSAYRGACARSLPMLIRDLTSAIDSRDVNRLGMLYLWAGVSDADAVRTFNRLQSIVERPLVDIVPLRREVAVALPPPVAPSPVAETAEARAPATPAAPSSPATRPDAMQWDSAGASEGASAGTQASAPPGVQPAVDAGAGPEAMQTRTVVTGLRLQQTAGKRATSTQVVLGLRRAYDCWWISLPGG